MSLRAGEVTRFKYTNHEGRVDPLRRVLVSEVFLGESPYYVGVQYFVKGYCLTKNDWRTFALQRMEPIR